MSKWGVRACLLAFILALAPSSALSAKFAILKSKNIDIYNDTIVGFKTFCNGAYTEFDMDEDYDKAKALAPDINTLAPDILLVLGTRAAVAAQKFVDKNIPVVFSLVLDPDKVELKGLSNVTGVKMDIPIVTQLQTLKAIVPKVEKIGVMYNPRRSQDMVQAAAVEAQKLGMQLVASRIERPEDAVRALTVFAGGIDAFWLIADPTVANADVFPKLLQFTVQNRTPFFSFSEAFVKARALFSLSADYSGIGKQACEVAQTIMGGTAPKDIDWQDPKGLKLSVNIKTAEQLGLSEISVNAFSYAAQKGYQIQPVQ